MIGYKPNANPRVVGSKQGMEEKGTYAASFLRPLILGAASLETPDGFLSSKQFSIAINFHGV